MKSTFKVLFYLKKGSEKKNGEVMIMARITIDGKLCQFSTKQSILPENWNIAAGKAKGKDAGKINALLEDIKASLNNIGKSSVSCPLKPSDSAPLKHSTMPP